MEIDVAKEYPQGHGMNVAGLTACCRKLGEGVIDCAMCLDTDWAIEQIKFSAEELAIAESILKLVGSSGQIGVTKTDLVVRPSF